MLACHVPMSPVRADSAADAVKPMDSVEAT
jgi:hypothetical protein